LVGYVLGIAAETIGCQLFVSGHLHRTLVFRSGVGDFLGRVTQLLALLRLGLLHLALGVDLGLRLFDRGALLRGVLCGALLSRPLGFRRIFDGRSLCVCRQPLLGTLEFGFGFLRSRLLCL
jgi:hypothetical protein